MNWDPHFASRSPMFAPVARHVPGLGQDWPSRAVLQRLFDTQRVTNALGAPLRLVGAEADALPYEEHIYARAELPVRIANWHDLFNVLVWLAYPRAKAALNERHCGASRVRQHDATDAASTHSRGGVRDALTVFDESGVIVTSSEAGLIEHLRAFSWKTLFWKERERERQSMRVFLFGHAMYEKALAPYIGLTAHARPYLVDDDFNRMPLENQLECVDALLVRSIKSEQEFTTPQALAPLPLLGVPGWWPANDEESFYDDTGYFRPGRARGSSLSTLTPNRERGARDGRPPRT